MLPPSIVFSSDPGTDIKSFLSGKTYSQIVVLLDTHTQQHCYPIIKDDLPPHEVIVVNPGEEYKNIETCSFIWGEFTRFQLDRHAVLIVLGGGVLGDMGGFCAATYKRGIDFVLIPTTLLAMVDASIGGKLGVDFQHFKNHIGLFKQPKHSILSSGFLKTLPEPELKSGFAEVIKHALLSASSFYNSLISTPFAKQNFEDLIKRSVEFKQSIIEQDPEESGLRKILNFGHSIGHALETDSIISNERMLHGQAIAIGMVAESHISFQKGYLDIEQLKSISGYLISLFGKYSINNEHVVMLIAQDKKNKSGKIKMALLEGVGNPRWDIEVSREEILTALNYYTSF